VPKNVTVESPLHAKITSTKNIALYSLIVLEEGSFTQYMEEYGFFPEQDSLGVSCTEVQVSSNAQLEFHYLCQSIPIQRNFHSIQAQGKENSSIKWHWASFGGKLNRLRIDTELIGNGASSENKGVFIGRGKEHIDATTNIFHLAESTTSNMEINGIMKENSSAIYRGLIKIDKVGKGTNSYLSNHILKLSDKAIANSIPALEIDNNEVKASHGATVGQIDEEQLFYLKSRGLSQQEGEALIVSGFLMPIIEKIKVELFKEKFKAAIEKENTYA
jgi:FeS assembly protein SufD